MTIVFAGKCVLPRRPHLDYLRKQAKARLAEMRAVQPDARLADAQSALAREYGFANWGALGAEVFRRSAADLGRDARAGRRRGPRPARTPACAFHDAVLEQAANVDTQTAFFMSGAVTNLSILFVIVAILNSIWVLSSAVPGG